MPRDAFAMVEFGLPFGKVGFHLLDERVMSGSSIAGVSFAAQLRRPFGTPSSPLEVAALR